MKSIFLSAFLNPPSNFSHISYYLHHGNVMLARTPLDVIFEWHRITMNFFHFNVASRDEMVARNFQVSQTCGFSSGRAWLCSLISVFSGTYANAKIEKGAQLIINTFIQALRAELQKGPQN